MKSTFLERLGAYIIDIIIIGIIAWVVSLGISTNEPNYENELTNLANKYTTNEITSQEFYNEYSTILYKSQKDNLLANGISIAITIAYFIVFQYLNKGQTIGKKLLKLRVVDKDTKKPPTIVKGIVRSMFIYSIASSIISIILINVLKSNSYIIASMALSLIDDVFIIVTIIFIIYRKDARGLHDHLANTVVIKEGR